MKTMSIGDHQVNELPSGDVEIVITERGKVLDGSGNPMGRCGAPAISTTITIPKRDRQRLADLLLGQEELPL